MDLFFATAKPLRTKFYRKLRVGLSTLPLPVIGTVFEGFKPYNLGQKGMVALSMLATSIRGGKPNERDPD